MTRRLRTRAVSAAVLALGLTWGLAGCGAQASPTCAEYLDTPLASRDQLNMDLLRKHDLKTTDVGNITGVSAAVSSFCANPSNLDRSLDDAVDWSADTW